MDFSVNIVIYARLVRVLGNPRIFPNPIAP